MIFRAIPVLVSVSAAFLLTANLAYAAPAKASAKAPAAAKAAPAKVSVPEPPVTVESLLTQSQAATSRGEIDLALRLAQSAIVTDPARPGSYVALGDIYAQAGQSDYARNFYDAALGIDPIHPAALKALAALDSGRASRVNAAR
jgi:tetratricopeptide (TPR) repeat protein